MSMSFGYFYIKKEEYSVNSSKSISNFSKVLVVSRLFLKLNLFNCN